MTSGYPEEECSLDMEGYLSPNNLLPQKEKQLDTIPEDESGYLLANHLPITPPDKVIHDNESQTVLVKDVSDENEIGNSKDLAEMELDVLKEEVVANGFNRSPPTDDSSEEVTESQGSERLMVAEKKEEGL